MTKIIKASRGKGRTYHHGDLRVALVAAARSILEKEGLNAMSLRGAARSSGVSQAAPYHHFADKDALLDAVAAQGFAELDSAMRARMAKAPDAMEKLVASGVAYVLFAVKNPALFRVMFGATMQDATAHVERLEAGGRAYGTLQEAVAGALVDCKPENLPVTFLSTWSLVHGLAMLLTEGGLDPAQYGAQNAEELAERMIGSTCGRDRIMLSAS